ncbi:DUF3237 domain-containing protein [Candidatus Litorirhabdus singularis]|nr:DUF3237 domain-containing protein [Candidatus Litorirhabdus singularis]
MAKIELHPLGVMKVQLSEPVVVGGGPKGTRMVIDVPSAELRGERINAELATGDAADWATVNEEMKLAALDVRLTLKTDDGAFIYVEYSGRMDMETGLLAVAPTFETGAPQYSWLNRVQAVAAGAIDPESGMLIYTIYEARPVHD